MTSLLLCVCVCSCACLCVCVAQLLNRWNAHYAADDNSVESKVLAPLYLFFCRRSFHSSALPHSHLHLFLSSPSDPSFALLCSPWLEASKHQRISDFLSLTHTHTHRGTACEVEGGSWVNDRIRIFLIFFPFYLSSERSFSVPVQTEEPPGRHAGGMQPPHRESVSVLL